MHAFLQNAISFALLYNVFVWINIQALYIQKNQPYIFPIVVLRFFFFFFFCKMQELRNPTNNERKSKRVSLYYYWDSMNPVASVK